MIIVYVAPVLVRFQLGLDVACTHRTIVRKYFRYKLNPDILYWPNVEDKREHKQTTTWTTANRRLIQDWRSNHWANGQRNYWEWTRHEERIRLITMVAYTTVKTWKQHPKVETAHKSSVPSLGRRNNHFSLLEKARYRRSCSCCYQYRRFTVGFYSLFFVVSSRQPRSGWRGYSCLRLASCCRLRLPPTALSAVIAMDTSFFAFRFSVGSPSS